jgi:hypothetical protein
VEKEETAEARKRKNHKLFKCSLDFGIAYAKIGLTFYEIPYSLGILVLGKYASTALGYWQRYNKTPVDTTPAASTA